MKYIAIHLMLFTHLGIFAQEEMKVENQKSPEKGMLHFEFSAGLNNTTPLGIQPKSMRQKIKNLSRARNNYKGALLPNTAAYVGIMMDYQFHDMAAFGTGLMYTPKGFWLFEENAFEGFNWIQTIYPKRNTFVTVDYFDLPIFFKLYLKENLISFRFGPVISMALLSKVRVEIENMDGTEEKLKYRLGEGSDPDIYYPEIPNSVPKFIVPGFEAALNIGNTSGLQGTCVVGFSGSIFENSDWKSFIARLGLSYSIGK